MENSHSHEVPKELIKDLCSSPAETSLNQPKIFKAVGTISPLPLIIESHVVADNDCNFVGNSDMHFSFNTAFQIHYQANPIKFISSFDETEGHESKRYINNELNQINVLQILDPVMHPHVHQQYCPHQQIRHHGHIDHVHNCLLHFIVEYGPIYEHELECSYMNPINNCPFTPMDDSESEESNSDSTNHSIVEFQKFNQFLKKICDLGKISQEERATISLKGYLSNQELEMLTNEDWCKQLDKNSRLDVILLMKQHHHIHSIDCGHTPIKHAGHIDYIVDGYLHFQHGNHCDLHGSVELVGNENMKTIVESYHI